MVGIGHWGWIIGAGEQVSDEPVILLPGFFGIVPSEVACLAPEQVDVHLPVLARRVEERQQGAGPSPPPGAGQAVDQRLEDAPAAPEPAGAGPPRLVVDPGGFTGPVGGLAFRTLADWIR